MRANSKKKERVQLKQPSKNKRRIKTEIFPIQPMEYLQTEIQMKKIRIQRDTVLKSLANCAESFKGLVETLESFKEKKVLSGDSLQKVAEHFFFVKSKFFRFEDSGHKEAIMNLKELIKSVKFLKEKIESNKNILRDQGYIFVKEEYQFCEFFKYLLGKQCPEFRSKYTRKVLQQIWNFVLFYEKYPLRIFDTLVLWAHGISIPLNPTRMRLHQAVIKQDAQYIKKACNFKLKQPIYCHINQADCNGITPLMLAVYLNKQNVLSTLLMQHADPYLVPLTKMANSKKVFTQIVQQIELLRGPLKIHRLPLAQPYYKNIMEYCKDNNVQLLAKLLILDTSRQFYSFKQNKYLLQNIQKIPDCTFQISWKQQAKLFSQGYADTIKISKKRCSLRFDFTVSGIFDKSATKGNYSLIFKGKPDIQYYLVDYTTKKITNLIKQLDIAQLQQKIMKIMKNSTIGKQYLTQCFTQQRTMKNTKTSYKQTTFNLLFQKQSIKKDSLNKTQLQNYLQSLADSNIIDYTKLTHSEIHYMLEQYIGILGEPSRKRVQQKIRVEMNTIPFFQLSMQNLLTISTLLTYFSPHFNKVIQVLKWQKMLEQMCGKGVYKEFPNKMVVQMKGINLVISLQNFNFNPIIKNQTFELLSQLQQQNFDCILPRGISFVRSQHQSVDESFLSSVTKFLKPQQQDFDFGEACLRYQKLIIDDDDPTLEESRQNEQKQSPFKKKSTS